MLIPYIVLFKAVKLPKLIFLQQKDNQVLTADRYFSRRRWQLWGIEKLAALNKENCEELPTRNLAQHSNVPRSQEDYITQVSEEIEGTVTNKLSQEFSKRETRILGALSSLDDVLMNPLIQGHSGTAPDTSRNAYGSNQGTNEDDSQGDPHPEAGIFQSQTTYNSGPEDGHDIMKLQRVPLGWISTMRQKHLWYRHKKRNLFESQNFEN